MPCPQNKKHPGQHVWKAVWVYNPSSGEFTTIKGSSSIAKNIDGDDAEYIVSVYNTYKKK